MKKRVKPSAVVKKERAEIEEDGKVMFDSTDELSNKERLFIAYYLQTMDASNAVAMAGYGVTSIDSRKNLGYKMLKKPRIKIVVDAFLLDAFMGAAEAKIRMSEQARSTIEDFVTIADDGSFKWNLKQAQERGKLWLVKKLKTKERWNKDERIVDTELELYDSQSALVHIGRLHNLFTERVELKTDTHDSPFDIMGKIYQAGIEKGTRIRECK